MPQFAIIFDVPMRLKVVAAVCSIIAIGLEVDAINLSFYSAKNEGFYAAVLCIGLLVSLLHTIGGIFRCIPTTAVWRNIEAGFYGFMAGVLLLSWILVVVNAADYGRYSFGLWIFYQKWQAETSFALIFGGLDIILYGAIAFLAAPKGIVGQDGN